MSNVLTHLRAVALGALLVCSQAGAQAQARIELNFNDARIDAVASAVASMVGKNVVVDPKVKGTMNLTSEQPVTADQAIVRLQTALRLHGVSLIEQGDVWMVVPEAEVKSHATPVNAPALGGGVQTRVFVLQHESAANMLNVVKPLVTPNNVVNVNPGTNALVVTDYADNVARIARLIQSLDRASTADLDIIALEHAIASEMVPLLQRLLDGGSAGAQGPRGADNSGPLQSTLMADSRSNALIVRAANPAKLAQIRSLVARLDQPSVQNESSAGNLHVVHLKHADAVALAETLRAAIRTLEQSAPAPNQAAGAGAGSAQPNTSTGTTNTHYNAGNSSTQSSGLGGNVTPLNLGQAQMPSVGGLVQADPNTNSLLITAPAPLFRQLRAVIDRLDSRRAQVLLESVIVEVSDNKLAEFGVQWQAAVGNNGSTLGAIGTNSNLSGGNILNIAAGLSSGDAATMASALGSLGGGMNLAIAPRALGQYYLGALANFLQQDGSGNVLSKPNLMTLDNQEARIIIGRNVPFVTGSYATTGGASTVNPFNTVERKDVGLMLRIRPTINENGTVKLTVYQEVSDIESSTQNNANGPTTSKRSIESTVLVEDGSILMLGGLMQDRYSNSVDKVPLLGDIPVVGNLFKSENRGREKTNLMVFLRPVVMRDAQSAADYAQGRYQEISALQGQMQPPPSMLLRNVDGAPTSPGLLPVLPAPALAPAVVPAPFVPTQPVPAAVDPMQGQPYSVLEVLPAVQTVAVASAWN